MKIRNLLVLLLSMLSVVAFAQDGGVKGRVVSREGRTALSNVKVVIDALGVSATTDANGCFELDQLPRGNYNVRFESPEFEDLDIMVRVDKIVKDLNAVVMVPDVQTTIDDSVFAEFDSDTATDTQALPSSLSASKDLFNNIASYKFSEMRFNVRGYDSQYSDVYLNGILFNDALTGYGPWSLWSGLNDATRNQETTSGLQVSDYGLGGVGGTTNINARASQMRKGFRSSVVSANSMYRFRAMVSYASGLQDNGWSYAFSVSTRQGGNSYVDGIYYNGFGYFASVEKLFGTDHRLSLTVMGAPTERGAQQASTQEAYDLFGNNYYNPNVGYQNGKMRNARVRRMHEPIVMLNYYYDITDRTRLSLATSIRFGYNGYSALTWQNGADPRPDYYRYLPSFQFNKWANRVEGDETSTDGLLDNIIGAYRNWTGMIDWDEFYRVNYQNIDGKIDYVPAGSARSNYIVEERHTDQIDYNFVANISHTFRNNSRLVAGLKARINRTEYYDEVKDLLGGDYWLDIDKFALRDMGDVNAVAFQNDLAYYMQTGHAKVAGEGDKISYDYYANVRTGQLWAMYGAGFGGFSMSVGGEIGFSSQWRDGLWCKGLFPENSFGKSEKVNDLTYKAKLNLAYRFSGAHSIAANVTMMQQAPKFQNAFVSPRMRNTVTPGLDTEKIFGADVSYNLTLPYLKARLSGYYTAMSDLTKVISFYDDTQSSFTNYAMSGIDKRYCGLELALQIPIWNGLSLNGALSWGDYRYTSNPEFMQTVDNSNRVVLEDKVYWKDFHVESTPQLAANIGLNYRGPHNWFASVDCNIYDNNYLSMNPMYRTGAAVKSYILSDGGVDDLLMIQQIRAQEKFDTACTLNASVGKNWYIRYKYTLGFSLEVKNILNDQDIRTGGYEQMRMNKRRNSRGETQYTRFDSKYFYLLGTNYYLNVYFRF